MEVHPEELSLHRRIGDVVHGRADFHQTICRATPGTTARSSGSHPRRDLQLAQLSHLPPRARPELLTRNGAVDRRACYVVA